jgi:hypothetical protein
MDLQCDQDGQVWTTIFDDMLFEMASQDYIARKYPSTDEVVSCAEY